MRTYILLTFLLLLFPLVSAHWLIFVRATPTRTVFTGYSDREGCIYVLSGTPVAFRFYSAAGVDEYKNVGQYICIPSNVLFSLVVGGTDVYVRFPDANVVVDDALLMSVRVEKFADTTLVSVYFPAFLAFLSVFLFVFLLVAVFQTLRRRRYPKHSEDAVVEYVAKHPGCSQKDIAKALGLEKYQVTRILARLEQRGVIVRIRRGISKRVYLKKQLQ